MVWSPALGDTAPVRANPDACGQGPAPSLLVLVQVELTSPFFDLFLEALEMQQYPKSAMTLRFSLLDATPKRRLAELNSTVTAWAALHGHQYREVTIDVANASEPVMTAATEIVEGGGPDRVLLLSSLSVLNNTEAIG